MADSPALPPVIAAQGAGALADALVRQGFVAVVATMAAADLLGALAPALFVAPFLLVSGVAGELADRYDNAKLFQWLKAGELLLAILAAWAFAWGSAPLLALVVLLYGIRAAAFGPVKYAILPRITDDKTILSATAWVAGSTPIAVLAGTAVAPALIAFHPLAMPIGVLVVALIGAGSARAIPKVAPAAPTLPIRWDPIRPNLDAVRAAAADTNVFHAVLGVGWFWTLGAALLALIPAWAHTVYPGYALAPVAIGAAIALGQGIGALLATRLSYERVELGLVPLGSAGITLFTLDLALGGTLFPALGGPVRVGLDLVGLGVAGGLFTVPLDAYIPWRSPVASRARVMAGENVIAALGMIAASLFVAFGLALGATPRLFFGVLAVLNAAVALYIYRRAPEFFMRLLAWGAAHVLYRVRTEGMHNIPADGPCVVVCNHVSFIDWMILGGLVRRPGRYVMYAGFYKNPVMRWIVDQARVIPIAGRKEDPARMEAAFATIRRELAAGELVGLFPEGSLTADGDMAPFRPGVDRIIAESPVPVIPLAINGLWGSLFSRFGAGPFKRPPRRFRSPVWLTAGEAVPPELATAEELERRVRALWLQRPDQP